jgi:hypothetical protein
LATPLIHFEVFVSQVMELWRLFMNGFLLLILKASLDTQTSLRKDGQNNFPKFKGLVITHVVKFLGYIQGMGKHEDVQKKQFIVSLPFDVQDWVKYCCKPRSVSSLIDLISIFLEYGSPQSQTYEDTLQELTTTLEEEGFFPWTIL